MIKNIFIKNVLFFLLLFIGFYYVSASSNLELNDRESSISSDNIPKICTMEYAPVCWQPKMPECPEWLSCTMVMPELKTYSNKCMLAWDSATYKYDWECNLDTKINTPPVCPTYALPNCINDETLVNEKDTNWCDKMICIKNSIQQFPYNDISARLRVKSKILINKFIKKIESKWLSNIKNREVIDNIILKINNLENDRPELRDLLNYLRKLLIIQKERYLLNTSEFPDDFSDL